MKKFLVLALFVCIIFPFATSAVYPVDVYIDFESGNNNDPVTSGNLNSGSHGVSNWTNQYGDDHMYISEDASYLLGGSVQVGDTTYTGEGDTRGFKFDPEGTTNNYFWNFVLPEPYPENASFGGYWKTTSTNDPAGSVVMGFSGYGDYVVTHNRTVGGGPAIRIKDGDTGTIPLTTNTWYYVTGAWRTGGLNELNIFNPSTGLLLGKTSVSNVSEDGAVTFAMGRSGSDATSGTGEYYFDNIILSYSGIFPLVPFTPKAASTSHNNDTGTYDNSVTVTVTTITPSASIYYCTDTAGTCTPNTLYTAPISINVDGTHLRTLSRRSGWTDSDIKDSTYTINSWRGPTYVQSCSQAVDGTSCTLSANVTAGNALAVLVAWEASGTLTSISDTCGTVGGGSNTYTVKSSTGNYSKGAVGYTIIGASKSCTITANFSGGSTPYILVHEITNVNQSTPVVSNQFSINYQWNPGSAANAVTSASITTTKNETLIFAATAGQDGGFTAGTGYVAKNTLTKYGSFSIASEQKNMVSAGSTVATFTATSGSNQALTGIIAFQRPDVYYVAGTISGLSGTVVLQNNGSGDLSISSNGYFAFDSLVNNGSAYNITVLTQPSGQNCIVTDGSGTVSGADVEAVVNCYSTANSITAFDFNAISPTITGTVNEGNHTVALTVPYGTSVTSLVPTISLSSGASVSPNTGISQDFTSPVTYTVTAEDGVTTQQYVVTVSVASPSSYIITASAGLGGSISPSGSIVVSSGNNKTFNISPNSGYSISSVLVDNVSVSTASSYTFNNVTGNHSISVEFIVNQVIANGPIFQSSNVNNSQNYILSLQNQVNFLLEQVKLLMSQKSLLGMGNSSAYNFYRDLRASMSGEDVRELQKFLNLKGFVLSDSGPGSPGQETDFFGKFTYDSLKLFQSSIGLPSTGFFGPMTREAIK